MRKLALNDEILLKKMHKINQKNLAKVLGTNRVQISKYETGKRKLDED